ncbi:MAG: carboxyl-terminal processing protease [Planctomycetota bacterium]|jgi:carboxyl-terminal processing protease
MQQQPRLPLWFLVLNWALILTAFVLGSYLGGLRSNVLPEPQQSALEIVYKQVLESHIEPPDENELLERAISGMVDGLDQYSRYIPPADVATYDENSTGNYQGIGAKMVAHGDAIIIHYPFPGSPAEKSGLLPGDRVTAVDGTQLADEEARRNVVNLVRGPADTTVTLSIDRDGQPIELEVPRGSVQRPCVKWAHFLDPDKGLGYLHLTGFHPTSGPQVIAAIESLEEEGTLRGLILDLRHDGGGSLDQCLDIGRAFLPSGIIATQKRRSGADIIYKTDPAKCRWPDLPLVVLVNENSASASEVLSGALQDHKRAVIVGKRTHGKGYVNTVYSWENREFKLKLTTGSYRTPNGRNIERNQATKVTSADKDEGGILPDVKVDVTREQQQYIFGVLHNSIEPPKQFRDEYAAVAKRYEFPVEQPPQADKDPQFAAAVEALQKTIDDQ